MFNNEVNFSFFSSPNDFLVFTKHSVCPRKQQETFLYRQSWNNFHSQISCSFDSEKKPVIHIQ